MNRLPPYGFLRLSQIIGDRRRDIPPIIPVGKSNWWEGVRSGRYPPAKKLSPGVTVWNVSDIRHLVDELQEPTVAPYPSPLAGRWGGTSTNSSQKEPSGSMGRDLDKFIAERAKRPPAKKVSHKGKARRLK